VDEIQFADGFDTTDRLLLGLGAGPLALLVATAAAAYLLTRSSMPAVITFPTAAFMLAVAAGVAWLPAGRAPTGPCSRCATCGGAKRGCSSVRATPT